jgi:hypothetical protein
MTNRPPVVEIIEPMVVESLRRMTPAERLAQAFEMWDFAATMMNSGIRQQRPDWSTEQIQREIRRRVRGSAEP